MLSSAGRRGTCRRRHVRAPEVGAGATVAVKDAGPERLKPFTVSAEKASRPLGSGARNVQFPAASTGTSSFCAPTVMRTLEFGATTEAGPAPTCPVIGSPAVTVPLAAAASVGLVRNSCSWTPPGTRPAASSSVVAMARVWTPPSSFRPSVHADGEVPADPRAAGVSGAGLDGTGVEAVQRPEIVVIVRRQGVRSGDDPGAHRVHGPARPARGSGRSGTRAGPGTGPPFPRSSRTSAPDRRGCPTA